MIMVVENKSTKNKLSRLNYYKRKVLSLSAENQLLERRLELAEKKIKVLNKYNIKFCYLDKMLKKEEEKCHSATPTQKMNVTNV